MKVLKVKVQIRNIAVGGHGVGEVIWQDDGAEDLLGITAFVPFSARGEVVEALVVQRKERFIKTELLNVIKPSESRVEPKCALYTKCGGCELQHITTREEHCAKLEMLKGALRAARFGNSILERVKEIETSKPYGYRRRVSLHVDTQGNIGFFQAKSRAVVPVTHCPIAVDLINDALKDIQSLGKVIATKISSILLETDNDGLVAVLKSPYDLDLKSSQVVLEESKKHFDNVVLLCGNKDFGGFGRKLLELPLVSYSRLFLRVPAGYFSQVNWSVNQRLIEKVLHYANPDRKTKILDLYSGAGNFSLPLAYSGAEVRAVECDKNLVRAGRQSATILRSNNLEFVEESVDKYLKRESSIEWDVVIADPPRSGLGKLASCVPKASRLILVYCQLPSFVRDLKVILDSGWKLKTIEPFDMFSKTSYIEVLAVFDKSTP